MNNESTLVLEIKKIIQMLIIVNLSIDVST